MVFIVAFGFLQKETLRYELISETTLEGVVKWHREGKGAKARDTNEQVTAEDDRFNSTKNLWEMVWNMPQVVSTEGERNLSYISLSFHQSLVDGFLNKLKLLCSFSLSCEPGKTLRKSICKGYTIRKSICIAFVWWLIK